MATKYPPHPPIEHRQPWEYLSLTGVLLDLASDHDELKTQFHLIGAGIILGSQQAYQIQEKGNGYHAPYPLYLAEESGLIAENIDDLFTSPLDPNQLSYQMATLELTSAPSQKRIYDFLTDLVPFSTLYLNKLGQHTLQLFLQKSWRKDFLDQLTKWLSLPEEPSIEQLIDFQKSKVRSLIDENALLLNAVKGYHQEHLPYLSQQLRTQ